MVTSLYLSYAGKSDGFIGLKNQKKERYSAGYNALLLAISFQKSWRAEKKIGYYSSLVRIESKHSETHGCARNRERLN